MKTYRSWKKLLTLLLAAGLVCCGGCHDTESPSLSSDDDTVSDTGELSSHTPLDPAADGIGKTLWICPRAISNDNPYVTDSFIDQLTDAGRWPELLAHTAVLKLYIQQLYTTPEADLKRLADFISAQNLQVAVELGGVRCAPAGTDPALLGEAAALEEYRHLAVFIAQGGRVDYITTDHALAEGMAGRNPLFENMTMREMMDQQMAYYNYMLARIPDLRVGAIESLGYFQVKGDRQYQATDPTLPTIDFETYFNTLLDAADDAGVTIDHFHIDFGYHDVKHDNGYGRILAVEDYVQSKGVHCGFIAGNAYHTGMAYPAEDEDAALRSAARNTAKYYDGYRKAGGHSDTLVFQRWQQYPILVGDESDPLTCMGIFHTLLHLAAGEELSE